MTLNIPQPPPPQKNPWKLSRRASFSVFIEVIVTSEFTCFSRLFTQKPETRKGIIAFAVAAKSLQLFLIPCDPIDGSPPGSPIAGILQARTLEWVAISFSRAWKWKVKVKSFSCIRLFRTRWTVAYQAPPSMGYSRQEYWSGLTLPSLIIALKPWKEDLSFSLHICSKGGCRESFNWTF